MMLTDYMCQEKKEENLPVLKTVLDASIQRLEDYIEKRGPRLITATRNNDDNTKTNIKKTQKNNRKQKGVEKQSFGRFKRLT